MSCVLCDLGDQASKQIRPDECLCRRDVRCELSILLEPGNDGPNGSEYVRHVGRRSERLPKLYALSRGQQLDGDDPPVLSAISPRRRAANVAMLT